MKTIETDGILFDEIGVEIPFPQVVVHRADN